MHDRVMKEYALVPESILNLRELFASWADNTWLPARKIQHKNDLSTTCAAKIIRVRSPDAKPPAA